MKRRKNIVVPLMLFVLAWIAIGTSGVSADPADTQATITFSSNPATDGDLVTITGKVVCTETHGTCVENAAVTVGTIRIQQWQVDGVGAACDTPGTCTAGNIGDACTQNSHCGDSGVCSAGFASLVSGTPDSNGQISFNFDTTGLGGSEIGFRTQYVTPGGSHVPGTAQSECEDLVIDAAEAGAAVFYLHNRIPNNSNTVAMANLPLDMTAPESTVLYNYATDLDSNSGVTGRFIDKAPSSEETTTTDLQKYQTWLTGLFAEDLDISGDVGEVQLKIWAKMKASEKNIQLRAFLRDCNSTLSSCTTFAILGMDTLTDASNSVFQELVLSNAAAISRTIAAGNVLQLRVIVRENIDDADPAYLAYDTVDFPASLTLP